MSNKLQYYIGIVPPESIIEQINQLRRDWDYKATEPHITIKASGHLNDNKGYQL